MAKRVRRNRKRKLKTGRIILAFIFLVIILFCLGKLFDFTKEQIIIKEYYVASSKNIVDLYAYNDETEKMDKVDTLYRGTKVKSNTKNKTIDDINYIVVNMDDNTYYINEENLVDSKEEVIKEEKKFVRTSATIYKNEKDSKIASFIKKGNELMVVGYDYYDDEGIVNMYKIKTEDKEGFVYGKYLVDTKEEAIANYNENGVYDTHKDRKYGYELYGGKASTLDYYPYERTVFKDNALLKTAKAMYLNAGTIGQIDSYLDIAKSSGVNAMVVDIKDGALAYPVEVAKEYSMTAYNTAINSFESYQKAIQKIKDAGIYAIGRIVVFNDSTLWKRSSRRLHNFPSILSGMAIGLQ